MDTTIILRRDDHPGRIFLSEAIAAGEHPSWSDAVAIIRAIAMHVHQSATPLHVPSLSQVAITVTGTVHVQGGRPYPSGPVPGVGNLLGQLLEKSGGPPPVQEIQRKTQADPPVYDSPLALHDALEYFARPDAYGVLTDFYNRAAVALEVASKSSAFEELKEKTKAQHDDATRDEPKKKKPQQQKSRRLYWAAAVVLIPIAAGLIAFSYAGKAAAPALAVPAAAALEAVTEASKQVQDATTNVVSRIIGGVLESSNASPPMPIVPVEMGPPAPQTRVAAAPRVDKPVAAAPKVEPPKPTASAAPAPPPPVAPTAPPVVTLPADVIYSAKDSRVRAPELVYPQLPTRQRERVPTSEFDMLVLEDGTVGEVRLIPASDRLQDRMMVSAAKAWRFRPAELDGQPVRYRVRIPIYWQ